MIKFKSVLFFIFLFLTFKTFAQFTISGEFRPRLEARNGYKLLSDSSKNAAFFVSQRTRLNLSYQKEKLKTYLSFHDVHVWGDELPKASNAGVGLFQAWVEYSFTDKVALKIGRQELKYDNQRLLSAPNWGQAGMKHDALVLKYNNKFTLDFVSAFNQNSENLFGTDYSLMASQNYKTLNVLWLSKKLNKFKISSLNIADGYQKVDNPNVLYVRFTTGGIVEFETEKMLIALRAYKQIGHNKNGDIVRAFDLNPNFTLKMSEKFKMNLGGEMMSGVDALDSTNTNYTAFDMLYGSNHSFNGFMDYFNKPSTTKNAGLIDTYFKSSFEIKDKLTLKLDYHYFALQNNYISNNETIDKYLGSEFDITAKYSISKEMTLDFGYSIMLATESMEVIKGGDSSIPGHFAFIMLTVKPEFFTTK